MKIDLRYPFLTMGIPPRNTRQRDIFVALPMSADIPSVALSETSVAFRTEETYRIEDTPYRYGADGKDDPAIERFDKGIVLRSYAGTLFRKISDTELNRTVKNVTLELGRAFPHDLRSRRMEFGADISFGTTGEINPLSAALIRQWTWELERESVGNGRVVNAWPPSADRIPMEAIREKTDWTEISSSIVEEDANQSHKSRAMIQSQISRLIVIDGDIWMSCRPPCFAVDVYERDKTIHVLLSIAHAFDGLDTRLSRRYFALDDIAGAREYMQQCRKKPSRERGEYQKIDAIPLFQNLEPELMHVDFEGEALSRIGYCLASECYRYLNRTHEWIDANKRDELEAAMHEVNQTNYVLGEFGDVAPYIDSLCQIWDKLQRPSTFCEVGPAPARKRFGDMMIRYAYQLAENAPIGITAPRKTPLGAGFGT